MAYVPKTAAAKELHMLMGELATAQLQWNTYATELGRGYTDAFGWHERALTEANEQYRLDAESAYWLLSLVCVAAAGGIVGGLLAPWVAKAGSARAATFISETLQSSAQGFVQKAADTIKPPPPSPFKPDAKSPLKYWQDLHGELGICFSMLRDQVEAWVKLIDGGTGVAPRPLIDHFLKDPLLKYAPKTDDMPNKESVARAAEIGMWISWASVRHFDYWKKRIGAVKNGVEVNMRLMSTVRLQYMEEFRNLNPVLDRLKQLKVDNLGKLTVKWKFGPTTIAEDVLDVIKLANAGAMLSVVPYGSRFMGKVNDVIRSPYEVLPSFNGVPPSYIKGQKA